MPAKKLHISAFLSGTRMGVCACLQGGAGNHGAFDTAQYIAGFEGGEGLKENAAVRPAADFFDRVLVAAER